MKLMNILCILFSISICANGKVLSEEDQQLTDQLIRNLLAHAEETGNAYLKEWAEKTPPGRIHNWIDYAEFDIEKAKTLVIENTKWREDNDIENFRNWDYSEEDDLSLPFAFCGFDDEGDSIMYGDFGKWDLRDLLSKGVKPSKMTGQLIRWWEWGLQKKDPKTGKYPDNLMLLGNLKGFALKQVTSIRAITIQVSFVRTFMTRYPLYTKKFILFDAPSYFSVTFNAAKSVLSAKALKSIVLFGQDENKWRPYIEDLIPKSALPDFIGDGEAKLNFITHENDNNFI